jgi:hypothetical protein
MHAAVQKMGHAFLVEEILDGGHVSLGLYEAFP